MLSMVSSVGGGTFGESTSLVLNDNATKGGTSSNSREGGGKVKKEGKVVMGGEEEGGAMQMGGASGGDGGSTPLSNLLATALEGQQNQRQSQLKKRRSYKGSTVSTEPSFMQAPSGAFEEKPLVANPFEGISARPKSQLDGGSVG